MQVVVFKLIKIFVYEYVFPLQQISWNPFNLQLEDLISLKQQEVTLFIFTNFEEAAMVDIKNETKIMHIKKYCFHFTATCEVHISHYWMNIGFMVTQKHISTLATVSSKLEETDVYYLTW